MYGKIYFSCIFLKRKVELLIKNTIGNFSAFEVPNYYPQFVGMVVVSARTVFSVTPVFRC